MVLAIACLIVNLTGSGALAGREFDAPGKEFFVRGRLKANSGFKRRRSPGSDIGMDLKGELDLKRELDLERDLGKNLGTRTAAPPITMPGIKAASSNATPATITPTVAAVVMRSCVGVVPSPARAEGSEWLVSARVFGTVRPRFHGWRLNQPGDKAI